MMFQNTAIGNAPDRNAILRFICSQGGVVQLSEICERNLLTNNVAAKFYFQHQPNYFRLEQQWGNYEVRAYTSAEICDEYDPRRDDCSLSDCSKFHLCKHYVTGSCTYGNR